MSKSKIKVIENIAKLSKAMAILAEGKQSIFLSYEPKKPKMK